MSDADDERREHPRDEAVVSRRWLIRILVGLGLGIPVAVEATTLLGLVSSKLFGGGSGDTTTAGPQTTRRPTTGIGDELLPETPPADILEDAALHVNEDAWRFTVTARVENTGDAPYTLRLGEVTTEAGSRVGGSASSGRVEPGESRTFTNAWLLPGDETPVELLVAGVTHTGDGDEETERRVRLGDIPVRG